MLEGDDAVHAGKQVLHVLARRGVAAAAGSGDDLDVLLRSGQHQPRQRFELPAEFAVAFHRQRRQEEGRILQAVDHFVRRLDELCDERRRLAAVHRQSRRLDQFVRLRFPCLGALGVVAEMVLPVRQAGTQQTIAQAGSHLPGQRSVLGRHVQQPLLGTAKEARQLDHDLVLDEQDLLAFAQSE